MLDCLSVAGLLDKSWNVDEWFLKAAAAALRSVEKQSIRHCVV